MVNKQSTDTTCPKCTGVATSVYEGVDAPDYHVAFRCGSCYLRWEETYRILEANASTVGGDSDGNIYMSTPGALS